MNTEQQREHPTPLHEALRLTEEPRTEPEVCERCHGSGNWYGLEWVECGQCAGSGKWAPEAAALFAVWDREAWSPVAVHSDEAVAAWAALSSYHREQGWKA